MDAGSQFERLIRMVQETGERMVISLDPHKDPIVLLPLTSYERLVAGIEKSGIRDSYDPLQQPRSHREFFQQEEVKPPFLHPEPSFPSSEEKVRQFRGDDRVHGGGDQALRAPFVPPRDIASDSVDVWDGEEAGEYDAERIFASAAVGNAFPSSSFSASTPDRLKASVSRASEAYEAMHAQAWQPGSGGQRLPIRGSSLNGEERFSLGMG